MIVTVTPNASIDKAYRIAAPVAVGEVQRVTEVIDVAGGKGLNAARAVAACGSSVVASGFAGGHAGALLRDLLDRDGVPHDFVEVAGETRSCINALDPSGTSTEFLEPGRPVTETEFEELLVRVRRLARKAAVVTIDGSVPAGLGANACARIVSAVKAEDRPVILDTSGLLLEEGVRALPTMVKPNADELAQLTGRPCDDLSQVVAAARALHGTGIEFVVVSLGADGAVMACPEGTFRGIAPSIDVVNPVGSGDTLVGAFAVAMERSMGAAQALEFAMAAATANCLSPATGNFDPAVAEELRGRTVVERIADGE